MKLPFQRRSIAVKLIVFILTSNVLIFLALFTYNYFYSRGIIIQKVQDNVNNIYNQTRNQVETVLRAVEKVTQGQAVQLGQSKYTQADLFSMIPSMVKNNNEIYGSTVAFEPYSFEAKLKYFSPYFYKDRDTLRYTDLGSETYQYPTKDWYQIPKVLKRPVWSEPYFDEGGGNVIMATYSVPFFRSENFMGIVTADISITWLQKLISSIHISDTGYAFLISKTGTYLSHPNKRLLMNESIFSLAESIGAPDLRRIGRRMVAGQSGMETITDPQSGRESHLFFTSLSPSGWSLGIVISDHDINADVLRMNQMTIILSVSGCLLLLLVIVLIARSFSRPLQVLSVASERISGGELDFEIPSYPTRDEIGRLTSSFITMKDSLKGYIQELTEATAARERLESELKIGRSIQMSMLPGQDTVADPRNRCTIGARLEPAKEVGGDLYDFFPIDDHRLCVLVGDVSGKGVPAALFMARASSLLRAAAHPEASTADIITRVNQDLASRNERMLFVTLFFAIVDLARGEMTSVNAGHNPTLLVPAGQPAAFLEAGHNVPLGIMADSPFQMETHRLGAGDLLALYTDGVTEAFNVADEMFGEERLRALIEARRDRPVDEIAAAVLDAVNGFATGRPQHDDITILCLRIGPGAAEGGE